MLYELPPFEHINATSVDEAVECLREYGDRASIIAGGTDLLGLMKDRVQGPQLKLPEVLVNIKTIPPLSGIARNEEGIRIGATVTLSQIEESDIINKEFRLVAEAARQVATTQIRNQGTIGGNICQRNRCLYFRHPDFPCYKKGGTQCFAITGENRFENSITQYGVCVMTHPSDLAPALVALKAEAIVAGPDGEKKIALQNLFSGPNSYKETVLRTDELVTGFQIPQQRGGTHQVFLKYRIRKSQDFALVSVAAVGRVSDGICEDISIVLGGVGPSPYVASGAERVVKGKQINEEAISNAAEVSIGAAHPLRMNRYKVTLAEAMIKRSLKTIMEQAAA